MSGTDGRDGAGAVRPSSEARPLLPRRFYKTVAVEANSSGCRVLLDGRGARTPRKRDLALPSRALAEAVAAEWLAQGDRIDPGSMPLTKLVNTAIDGIVDHEAVVRNEIVKFAGTDLLCYRADSPEGLVARQAELWDPILEWARTALAARFVVAEGLMPVPQPKAAVDAVAVRLADIDAFRLTSLHVITTLTGSCLLALAHLDGVLDEDEAWAAAHVDEDWQIAQWGEDAEAASRRAKRRAEMAAACRLLAIAG